MGVDITCFAETYNPASNSWHLCEDFYPGEYLMHEHNLYIEECIDDGESLSELKESVDYFPQPLSARNHLVFAFLGRAESDDSIEPISPPRGLPSDKSDYRILSHFEVRSYLRCHSHLTLKELNDYDYECKKYPIVESLICDGLEILGRKFSFKTPREFLPQFFFR